MVVSTEEGRNLEEELERDVKEFLLHFAAELEALSMATIKIDDDGGWIDVKTTLDEERLRDLYQKDNHYLPATAFFSGPYWIPPFEEDVEVEIKELASRSGADPWEVGAALKEVDGVEIKGDKVRFPKEYLEEMREWKLFHIHVAARKNQLLSFSEVFYRLKWNGNEALSDTYREVSEKILEVTSAYTGEDKQFMCLDLLLTLDILTKFLEGRGGEVQSSE